MIRALTLCTLALALSAPAAVAQEGDFRVSPVIIHVPAERGVGSFRLRNGRDREAAFQVEAFAWTQIDGESRLTPTHTLLVAPSVFLVPPGDEQIVRIGVTPPERAPRGEVSYRLIVRELPGAAAPQGGFRLLVEMSLPVFVRARDAHTAFSVQRTTTAEGAPAIAFVNTGEAHAALSAPASAQALVEDIPRYVLAGARIVRPLTRDTRTLRPGLVDYSVAVGAERENFARSSNEYGRGFVSGLYRRGLTSWLTGEARLEAADGATSVGVGASTAAFWLGQVDAALAVSSGAHEGTMARLGALREVGALSFYAEAQAASADFRHLGEGGGAPRARLRSIASVSADFERAGAAALTFVSRDHRVDDDVRTIALSYAPAPTRWGRFSFNALYTDEEADGLVSIGLQFSTDLGRGVGARYYAESDRGRVSAGVGAQRGPDPAGGFGWRMRASGGARERAEASVAHIGAAHEASLDLSHTPAGDGVRGQYAAGFAWIDGAMFAARPIRESFALVDVGIADVRVFRDRRPVGVTDERGRLLMTGLRAYEANPVSVRVDELPFDAHLDEDEIVAVPAAHSGVVVRFARADGRAGEARIVDALGAPLPEGAILVRDRDGARFPVGAAGRVYLFGLDERARFTGATCALDIGADDLGEVLQCRAA